jgi:hypothetical protein
MPSPFARPENNSADRSVSRIVVAVAGVALLGAATVFGVSRARTQEGSPYRKPGCGAQTTVTCLVSWKRTATGGTAVFNRPAGREFKYVVGGPGDVLMTGNWFCGLAETLVLYRPSSGVVYYFGDWRLDDDSSPVKVLADATGLMGASSSIGDINSDSCADVGLATKKSATWFLPAVQRGRLVEMVVAQEGP